MHGDSPSRRKLNTHLPGGRLTPLQDRRDALYPLRRAKALAGCHLYWIPVSAYPLMTDQRQWLLQFFEHLADFLVQSCGFEAESFLQFKVLPELLNAFLSTRREFYPIAGLSRRPGSELPIPPTKEELSQALKGEKEFDVKEWVSDRCYWFTGRDEKRQRREFFGWGGLTVGYHKPDANAKPPHIPLPPAFRTKHELFQMFDLEKMIGAAFSLKAAFLEKSKELFGADLKSDPQYPGILFILPLLSTADFFELAEEDRNKWFELFDVYIHESTQDQGVIVASKTDLEEPLIEILSQMASKCGAYPER